MTTPRLSLAFAILCTALGAVAHSAHADKPRRVKVHAQPRPGAPAEDIEMRVHPVPTDLNIVHPDSINLPGNDIVVGVIHHGAVVAYPVRFLSQHEIVADVLNGLAIAPSWSAITGSAVVYGRHVDGRELTFEFGEGLIDNNLLFVDRETDSVWSQLHGKAIAGPLKDTLLTVIPTMQVTWKYWRKLHPESWVWLPEGDGHPYYYRDFEPGSEPPKRSDRHDLTRLGLGLVLENNTMFFPISELVKARIPAIVVFGEQTVAVYYDEVAKGAWAIDGNLELLPTVLVYDWAWSNFFPDSGVYKADGGF